MRTSELISRAQISRDTLRYYEQQGVISQPRRLANGYRDYAESVLQEISFIRLAQSVGLPLSQIKLAVPHLREPKPGCPILREALLAQLRLVENKMQQLSKARTRLQKWLQANTHAMDV
jgi:DNA-binding transcriptional MerR regulator